MESIRVEELEGGLRAAFINLPHFRTHSARLAIGAGASHETPDAYGGAHFLEHITFQGTEGMPTKDDVDEYSDINGLSRNAFTSKMMTNYIADGYTLDSVGTFVSQVALAPRLTDEALEGERKPIVDELRGYESDPRFHSQIAHNTAVYGEAYGRSIGGSIQDVLRITPESLRAYHRRHYQLGNALLVISSAAPIEEQREFARGVAATFSSDQRIDPNPVEFDQFNPSDISASLEKVELPITAQSTVSVAYEVPPATSIREQLGYSLVGAMLSKTAHNRLRGELALCYGAGAGINTMTDQNFGNHKSWSYLNANASLNGEDVIAGLEALTHDVLQKPLDEKVLNTLLVGVRRDTDHVLEGSPSMLADRVVSILTSSDRDEIELDELRKLADDVSIDELRKLHRNIVDSKSLILATSPDETVLQAVGDWSSSL